MIRIITLCFFSIVTVSLNAQTEVAATPTNKYYYYEKSRPKDKIVGTYPYDIPLKTPAGDSLTSDKAFTNGKPTVLIFWLTTCYPCRMEMDAIAGKMEEWKKTTDFNIYAISTDFEHNAGAIKKRYAERNWPFPFYWDVNKEFKEIMPGGLNGLPQCFVLDKKGNIVFHKRKYSSGDEDLLFEEIKTLAAQ